MVSDTRLPSGSSNLLLAILYIYVCLNAVLPESKLTKHVGLRVETQIKKLMMCIMLSMVLRYLGLIRQYVWIGFQFMWILFFDHVFLNNVGWCL